VCHLKVAVGKAVRLAGVVAAATGERDGRGQEDEERGKTNRRDVHEYLPWSNRRRVVPQAGAGNQAHARPTEVRSAMRERIAWLPPPFPAACGARSDLASSVSSSSSASSSAATSSSSSGTGGASCSATTPLPVTGATSFDAQTFADSIAVDGSSVLV